MALGDAVQSNDGKDIDINAALEGVKPDDVNEDTNEDNNEEQMSDMEIKAREQGWTPKDDFKGKDENWKPASQYVEWGEMKSHMRNMGDQIKGMKKSHNDEIANLNLFNKASSDARVAELEDQLIQAVEDGDHKKVKAINDEQLNISNQNVSRETPAVNDQVLQSQWELDNTWINDVSDKRYGIANSAFNLAIGQGKSMEETLEFVNQTIEDKFPNGAPKVNHNRNQAGSNSSSGGAPAGGGGKEKLLTMKDASPQDMVMFHELFGGDEKKFLKALTNSRK